MGASAKDPPLKLTSMLIGISLIKILVFYKIFFLCYQALTNRNGKRRMVRARFSVLFFH